MKKEYQSPELNVEILESIDVLSASGPGDLNGGKPGGVAMRTRLTNTEEMTFGTHDIWYE